MGSVLGPTFSNFYMFNLEKNSMRQKKHIYVHYFDDVLILADNIDQIFKNTRDIPK